MIHHQQIVSRTAAKHVREQRRSMLSFMGGRCSFLLLLLLACAACGGGAHQAASNGNASSGSANVSGAKSGTLLFDPCMMLSREDAAQVLGSQVSAAPDLAGPVCRYAALSTGARKSSTEKNILVSVGSSDDAAGYFSFEQTVAKGTSAIQPVTDLGNEAFFLPLSFGGSLEVRQGLVVYTITLLDSERKASALQETLKKLAVAVGHAIATGTPSLAVSTPHPCQLITAQEASQEFQGHPVHWLLTANSAGVANCDYVSSLGASDRLLVMTHEKQSGTKALYEQKVSVLTHKKALVGVGDEAFYDGVNTSLAWKQNAFFYVSVLGLTNPEPVSERLARLAYPRFLEK